MPDEFTPDEIKQIWQAQKVEGTVMSLDEIRRKAAKFQKRISRRNAREYMAGAAVVILMTSFIIRSSFAVERAAAALCIAGIVYAMYRLHRLGSAQSAPADLGLTSSLQFHRRELERQRKLLQNVWPWYLAPLMPGLALFVISTVVINPGHLKHPGIAATAFAIAAALVFYAIACLNERAALRLQRSIDELDTTNGAKS